jgi:hypothetical protein
MLNRFGEQCKDRESAISGVSAFKPRLWLILALGISIALFQFAYSMRDKVSLSPTTTTRVAFLPFNVSENNKDLRWTAMAAPIVMAQASRKIKDFEVIPLWQTMPLALQTAGNSRILTQESAVSIASWLSARWAAYGEFRPAQNGATMVIDFIPSKENMIPFRYSRTGKLDGLGSGAHKAFEQFTRYIMTGYMLEPEKGKAKDFASLRSLAEALDREYGWTMEADPGKAQGIVADLIQTDEQLAHYLFSPTLYPALAKKIIDD